MAAAARDPPPATPANAAFAKVDDLRIMHDAVQKELADAAAGRPLASSSWLYGSFGSSSNGSSNGSSRCSSVHHELHGLVLSLGGELGKLLGIDLMVEALAAVVR
jgi:hypothetical protein